MKKLFIVTLLLVSGILLLSGCADGLIDTPEPTPVEDDGVLTGEATVDEIDVLILESFPVQVNVIALGNLSDACTDIGDIVVEGPDNNMFTVTVETIRPSGLACAQVLTPFEESISLPVEGLPAGVYTVEVNGVTDTFELQVDNFYSEE